MDAVYTNIKLKTVIELSIYKMSIMSRRTATQQYYLIHQFVCSASNRLKRKKQQPHTNYNKYNNCTHPTNK